MQPITNAAKNVSADIPGLSILPIHTRQKKRALQTVNTLLSKPVLTVDTVPHQLRLTISVMVLGKSPPIHNMKEPQPVNVAILALNTGITMTPTAMDIAMSVDILRLFSL